jgi:hypothetical protein
VLRGGTDAGTAAACDRHLMSIELEWLERARAYEAAARRRADAARRHAAESRRVGNPKHAIRYEHEAEVHERVAFMQGLIADGLREREMHDGRGRQARRGDRSRAWAANDAV